MNIIEDTEGIAFIAIFAIIAYVGYELYKVFSDNSYCCNNPSSLFCSLFAGPCNTSGQTTCTGLGCSGALACSYGFSSIAQALGDTSCSS
jgi:hypothetical protein